MHETFQVKGLATDAKGPLGKMTVIAGPSLLPETEPVARFWLQDVLVVKDVGRTQNEFLQDQERRRAGDGQSEGANQ